MYKFLNLKDSKGLRRNEVAVIFVRDIFYNIIEYFFRSVYQILVYEVAECFVCWTIINRGVLHKLIIPQKAHNRK